MNSHNNKKTESNFIIKIKRLFEKLFNNIDQKLGEIILYIKSTKTLRSIINLTVYVILCIAVIMILYYLLKPSLDNYGERLEKSYIREIFIKTGTNTDDFVIENDIITVGNNNRYEIYKIYDSNNLIGYGFIEYLPGSKPNTDITTALGIYTDMSFAGLRIIEHSEPIENISLLENIDYLKLLESDYITNDKRFSVINKTDIIYGDIFKINDNPHSKILLLKLKETILNTYNKIEHQTTSNN